MSRLREAREDPYSRKPCGPLLSANERVAQPPVDLIGGN